MYFNDMTITNMHNFLVRLIGYGVLVVCVITLLGTPAPDVQDLFSFLPYFLPAIIGTMIHAMRMLYLMLYAERFRQWLMDVGRYIIYWLEDMRGEYEELDVDFGDTEHPDGQIVLREC
ncbi:hypothetical protein QQZ08_007291 [Neonectria magnoliae]|uniref:SMODS and SLOG-associating 2TM effector domain-containing protein n=1 Tax=Neonectria magnoliae TaxID=2732573 RepID=A0ABR1HYY2_9HYPO